MDRKKLTYYKLNGSCVILQNRKNRQNIKTSFFPSSLISWILIPSYLEGPSLIGKLKYYFWHKSRRDIVWCLLSILKHKTGLNPPLFIDVSILPLSTILIFYFGIVPSVWYFLFFILLSNTNLIVKYYICFNVSRRMWLRHKNRTAHKHDPF